MAVNPQHILPIPPKTKLRRNLSVLILLGLSTLRIPLVTLPSERKCLVISTVDIRTASIVWQA